MRHLNRVKRWWERKRGDPWAPTHALRVDADALRWVPLTDGGEEWMLPWSRISAVAAYKRDLLTTDAIRLAFDSADGWWIEADEAMPGWDALLDRLPGLLPGFPRRDEWWPSVVRPPFAANRAVLWRKGDPDSP